MFKGKKAAALACLVGLLTGCNTIPFGPDENRHTIKSTLSPEQCAWSAASALAMEIPTSKRWRLAPTTRLGPREFSIEARARQHGLFRFRRGGSFYGKSRCFSFPEELAATPIDLLVEKTGPAPLVERTWARERKRPFPLFYESRVGLTINGQPRGGSRLEIYWTAGANDPLGISTLASLRRTLALSEPLAQGNKKLRAGDPVGALVAYDRAMASGAPPYSRNHARLLARIHLNRGLALARIGALEESRIAFSAAGRFDKELTAATILEGILAYRTGRLAWAREILSRVVDNQGAVPSHLYTNIRKLLSRCGNANRQEERSLLLARGQELLTSGRAREARQIFRVVRTSPQLRQSALRGLAQAAIQMGNLDGARDHLLHGLSLNPAHPTLLADLAAVEKKRGAQSPALYLAAGLLFRDLPMRQAKLGIGDDDLAAALSMTRGLPLGRSVETPDPLSRALAALVSGNSREMINLEPEPVRQRRKPVMAAPLP